MLVALLSLYSAIKPILSKGVACSSMLDTTRSSLILVVVLSCSLSIDYKSLIKLGWMFLIPSKGLAKAVIALWCVAMQRETSNGATTKVWEHLPLAPTPWYSHSCFPWHCRPPQRSALVPFSLSASQCACQTTLRLVFDVMRSYILNQLKTRWRIGDL
jgi:hypothetical protein